jgi:nitrite reductase/ring-hydroxylating ferredoxin subunit
MSATITTSVNFIRVGTLDELQEKGCIVVSGEDRPIAVFFHNGEVRAVDNRCPHLGFPLHRGSVQDGILTCHWHHARFDLKSGCTFDLWADDVPTCPVEIRDGEVWVCGSCHYADEKAHWKHRLREGMQQSISLIIAKAILGMTQAGVDYRDIVREAALFGARYRDGWASGMTIMTAMANLVPYLPEEETYLALYQGLRRVANDCAGETPRRDRHPLETEDVDHETLKRWLRYWTLVRHRDGGERTLLTKIEHADSPMMVADLMFTAATDRYYADGGHALDFINKAFEVLDLIGWEHSKEILPTVVRQLVAARGGEESNAWRHPMDLVPLLDETFKELPALMEQGRYSALGIDKGMGEYPNITALAHAILGDDPIAIVNALKDAIRSGAPPTDLSKALAYAAALRIARFGTANEFSDWITALHTFTYCNALHQGMKRLPSSVDYPASTQNALRGVFHGAMSVYLDRFLNIPPARLPGERGDSLDDEPTDADELREKFLAVLDTQQKVDEAARIVSRYVSLGHPIEPLVATLTRAVVREDADFHTFQMLEAGVRQYEEWRGTEEGKNILIAVARYLAAHSPTQRAQLQTARIALRLHRGESLYEEEDSNGAH